MNYSPSRCKEAIAGLIAAAGASAWGVTSAQPISPDIVDEYRRWLSTGAHGEMDYLAKYDEVRSHPALLLDGAVSIIAAAFPYYSEPFATADGLSIASYAVGEDYHTALRRRLAPVVEWIEAQGYAARVCIDTAPLRERYIAQQAGLGFIGRNNMLIIPGKGSFHFLTFVVTTMPLPPDAPSLNDCGNCGACVAACPGRALDGDKIDCRRCLSYLSIEYRGEQLPDDVEWGSTLYGCDRCQRVCPHNRASLPAPLPEFMPREELRNLTAESILSLTPSAYKRQMANSAMQRARLPQLQRNARRALRR